MTPGEAPLDEGYRGPVTDQSPDAATGEVRSSRRPSPGMPVVRAATAVASRGLVAALDALDAVALTTGRDALDDVDLVVVEPATFASLPADARDAVVRWAEAPGRPPIVVWADGPVGVEDLVPRLRERDVVAATGAAVADELRRATGRDPALLPPSFDPAWANPRRRGAVAAPAEPEAARHTVLHDGRPTALTGVSGRLAVPPVWLLELAAAGIPIDPGAGPDEADRAGVAARRWAYRHHAPWVRARHLLALAGVDAPDPDPTVAGILVSKRAEDLPRAIGGFLRQSYPKVELVVALHGPGAITQVERLATDSSVPTTVVHLDNRMSLGECLNRAIADTSAQVLAKIDDDDQYGPAFLEDGVHALAYSGADIVGKGAQFTYLRSDDVTVLRHQGREETFIEASPRGASLLVQRDVWEQVRFPHRPRNVDGLFLRGARRLGASVYANSRWEFCFAGWADASDEELAGAIPVWEGFQPERVEVPDVAVPI